MKAVYVKYQVDPSFAETNAENIRKVMSALRENGSDGVRYRTRQAAAISEGVLASLHKQRHGFSAAAFHSHSSAMRPSPFGLG
jgi:hypothetical protein